MAATSTSSDPSAATATANSTSDGPVLNVISKRLRALRKKHNRIIQMEESLSQGKTLNSEQQEVLRSKSAVIASIDELEKLRSPISSALEEEISLAVSSSSSSSKLASSSEAETKNEEQEQQPSSQEKEDDDHNHGNGYELVKDLLNLMYFGSLFDVKPQTDFTSLMITRNHERSCCLTYDYVTDDATDLLAYGDLDLISALQGLMVSRPANAPVSHQNALEKCIQHAKLWLENSQQPIDPQANVTYAGLKEKLNKIMASDYFTATPQMKVPGEVAAAAVGNFGSLQVPMHENMVPVEVPVEGSVENYPDTEDHAANYEEYETGEQQTGNADEFQKGDVEAENPAEMVSAHTEQEQAHAEEEHGYRNVDYKEQQYIPRRGGQRGGRGGGGGRRGYPNGRGGRVNGRGGGPYQNGRNQYHENYYPRNNYYNRRGGRGAGGLGNGGNPHYNQSSAGQVVAIRSTDQWSAHFESSKRSYKLMVVDFSASWCGPCQYMEPVVEDFSTKYSDVEFVKIDVDELSDVASEFGVDAMPTFVFFKKGKEVDRLVGANKSELKEKIIRHRA